jgi:hypothetical protein
MKYDNRLSYNEEHLPATWKGKLKFTCKSMQKTMGERPFTDTQINKLSEEQSKLVMELMLGYKKLPPDNA